MKPILKIIIPFLFVNQKILFWYRISNTLEISGFTKLALLIESFILWNYGCAISCKSEIDKSLKLPHPLGVVIGANVYIGKNVTIYQGVTLGRKSSNEPKYPKVKDGCIIYSNSVVLGGITLDTNTIVGACSLLTKDTEADSVYIGIPAKKVVK